jgi:MFS transporter, PHS family, inorganic phosphate transporter
MLGYAYFRNAVYKGKIPSKYDEGLKVGTSAGAIIGQLLFGFLCDKIGRKRVSILRRIHAYDRCMESRL